jgi:hypothetical protein
MKHAKRMAGPTSLKDNDFHIRHDIGHDTPS